MNFVARHRLLLAAFVLGAISVLGFAPFHLFPLPVATLALLFHLWRHHPHARAGALLGFCFGLGFFLAGVSWVYVSMHDFGAMPMPLAVLATLLFCAVLALFPALAGWLQMYIAHPTSRFAIAAPALWVLLEWARGRVFTGFPWLAFGYSQVPDGPLAGYAPLFGVYGVSLAVALSAGWVLLAWHARGSKRIAWAIAIVAMWGTGYGAKQIEWTQPFGEPLTVSLLQGDIPQEMKFREDRLALTLDTYATLARESSGRLIVLPETALPLFYHDVPRDYLDRLAERARSNGGDILIGLPERAGERDYYNSVLSFGSAPTQTYRKSHLVPFGEFVPLKPMFGGIIAALSIPLSDFSRGAAQQQPLQVAGQRVAVNICYEDAFGEEIIRQLPQATLLVNVSNVAWFGRSIAPYQHLQISQMRALEAGRTMLRATNTGMTAIIDAHGQVVQSLPEFTTAALHGEAQGMQGATPYVRWGNWPALVLIGLMLAVAWLGKRR
ncbi:MAG: apolipoprotein N-acyltransferase [Pseudomonadota bacterium]